MRIFLSLLILIAIQLNAGIGVGYSGNGPLPVELITFSAVLNETGVVLNWTTATELNNFGFEIERGVSSNEYVVGSKWEKIGFVKGNGNSNSLRKYIFLDKEGNSNYSYRLKQIDNNGTFKYSPVIETNSTYKMATRLEQNFPNPFNPSTIIEYGVGSRENAVSSKEYVVLKIYDVLGREIETLVDEQKTAGKYSVEFDATKYPAGIYYYEVRAGEYRSIKKMLYIK